MPTTDAHPQMRILLVDDDEDVRISIYNFLTARNHNVVQAENGKDAVSHIDQDRFDIVITDIKMAGATGYQILQHVKHTKPETEVNTVSMHSLAKAHFFKQSKTLLSKFAKQTTHRSYSQGKPVHAKKGLFEKLSHFLNVEPIAFKGKFYKNTPDNLQEAIKNYDEIYNLFENTTFKPYFRS